MARTVSQVLLEDHNVSIRPGAKGKCPFCKHTTFSVKSDDSLGKCFHASCARFLTVGRDNGRYQYSLARVLESIFQDCHQELLRLASGQHNAYTYLRDERGIHPKVIADAMLGAVPSGYDIAPYFQPVLTEAQALLAALQSQKRGRPTKQLERAEKRLQDLQEAQQKLVNCLAHRAGWVVFFYTDAAHRCVALRLRQPYEKKFVSFKPGIAGVFGRELFTPFVSSANQPLNQFLMVVEGEFNALQLQSLTLHYEKETSTTLGYVNCCAVGSVTTVDIATIQRVAEHPVICYDHDANGAGFELVKALQQIMVVEACTTPAVDSDLDSYIKTFFPDPVAAWQAVQALITQRQRYGLPHILLTPGVDITLTTNAMQQAILELPGEPRLYQRAHRLSLIAHGVTPPKWLQRSPDAPVIIEANAAYLRELAQQAAHWEKFDKRTKTWEPTHPPIWVTETLQGRPFWPFLPLEGVIAAPTLRPDGSLLDMPGYDAETGLYLDTNGTAFPLMPEHVTIDDARTAIGALQEALWDFPFVKANNKAFLYPFAAALAAILSVICRFAILGNVPLFGVTSTTPGSGKGLLVDVLSMISSGRPAPRWPQSDDDAEDRKRLLTVAMAGDACIHIDNILRPLGSPALDMALTSPSVSDRVLGQNAKVEAPLNMVWFASGNNLQYAGDLARRVVPIPLDPEIEKPEERTNFKHNPLLPWVRAKRPELVVSALTILKAYFEAGCPKQSLTPFGSFQEWSDLVRSCLVWAGEADCCEGRATLSAESDPAYEALATLLECWQVCYPLDASGKWPAVTLNRVIQDVVNFGEPKTNKPFVPNSYDDLRDALGALDPKYDGAHLQRAAIGAKLRTWQGRVVGKKRLVNAGTDRRNVAMWQVETLP
jgi:hypothetical protein